MSKYWNGYQWRDNSSPYEGIDRSVLPPSSSLQNLPPQKPLSIEMMQDFTAAQLGVKIVESSEVYDEELAEPHT